MPGWRGMPRQLGLVCRPRLRISDADLMRGNVAVTCDVRSLLVAAQPADPGPPEHDEGAAAGLRSRLVAVSEAVGTPIAGCPMSADSTGSAPDGKQLACCTL